MAEYSILITSSPFEGDTALRALAFIQGVIDNGDVVNNVFFYSEGVHHCNSLMLKTGDELFAYDGWKALAADHNVNLMVCITAAVKRGIVSEMEAKENGMAHANLTAPLSKLA